jgi:hypothetical protein
VSNHVVLHLPPPPPEGRAGVVGKPDVAPDRLGTVEVNGTEIFVYDAHWSGSADGSPCEVVLVLPAYLEVLHDGKGVQQPEPLPTGPDHSLRPVA